MIRAVALVVAAYLIGSLSPSVFLGRLLKGIDVRRHGSGNPGTTNSFRVLGPGLGTAVLIADILKGFAPVYAARLLEQSPLVIVLVGLAALAGHNYSVFLRGRGGKGIATSAGVVMAMTPLIFLVLVGAFGVVLLLTATVSAGSLTATVLYPLLSVLTGQPLPYQVFSLVASLVVAWAHRANIRRLATGREPRIKFPWRRSRRPQGDRL